MTKRWMMALMLMGSMLVVPKWSEAPAQVPGGSVAVAGNAAPMHTIQAEKVEHVGGFLQVVTRAGWFGVLIWLMLFGCSIVSVALVIDSYMTIRWVRVAPAHLSDAVRSSIDEGDLMKAMERCDGEPCALSRILVSGFSNVQEGYEAVQDAVSVAADLEAEKMLQRVTYLSVISNTTPMLGLIGTVQGMIYAFITLGTMQAGAAQQAMLAINISHGLWATAVGLGVSVPATIFYFFFKNKAMRLILGMEAMTLDLTKALRNVEVVEG